MTADGPDFAELTRKVTEAVMRVSEAIAAPAIEATQGYRAQVEAAGFSPAIAEQMAATYHVELVKALFSSMGAKK